MNLISSQNKLGFIRQHAPTDYKRFVNPAVGDGSVFLHMSPQRWLINEEQSSVHNMWSMVKTNPVDVVRCLRSDYFDEISKPAHAALYMYIHYTKSIKKPDGSYNDEYFKNIDTISEYMNTSEGEIYNMPFCEFTDTLVQPGDFMFLDHSDLKNNTARSSVPEVLFNLDKRGVRWMLIHDNNVYVRTMFNRFRSSEISFNSDSLLIKNY